MSRIVIPCFFTLNRKEKAMTDLALRAFKDSFDSTYGYLEKAVELCPDTLWAKKTGGFLFWQQLYHIFTLIDFTILEPNDPPTQSLYPIEVARLLRDEPKTPTKAEILAVAATMKKAFYAWLSTMTAEKLAARNELRSQRFGREISNFHALILLVGHGQFHVGECDAAFRDHGLGGLV